jgi:hypothetical protein
VTRLLLWLDTRSADDHTRQDKKPSFVQAVVQDARPVIMIKKRGHENCWNRAACLDESFVKVEPAHPRHRNVGDQARRLEESEEKKENRLRRANATVLFLSVGRSIE